MQDGEEHLHAKRYYAAITHFEAALKVPTYEDNATAKKKLAEAKRLEEERKRNDAAYDENMQTGDMYLQAKRYDIAILSFEAALKVPTYEDDAKAKGKLAVAKRLELASARVSLDCGAGVKLELTPIKAGNFVMGAPESKGSEVQHQVSLSKNFYLGVYEVTQEQWQAVMGNNSSFFNDKNNSLKRPVENVSWNDAQEFCRKLSLKTGKKVRLPTEAEWEYACRAGTTTPFSFGSTINTRQANYSGYKNYGDGVKEISREETTAVGIFPPNAWGLYDMHGNVGEWCQDVMDGDYYKKSPTTDPVNTGSEYNSYRVYRGGSWSDNTPGNCRSANRYSEKREHHSNYLGFRIAMD